MNRVHESNKMDVPCVDPICDVVEFTVKFNACGGGVVGSVVAMGVNVSGGAVFDVSSLGVSFDFGGVGGQVVFGVNTFEEVVPHVTVVLQLPVLA